MEEMEEGIGMHECGGDVECCGRDGEQFKQRMENDHGREYCNNSTTNWEILRTSAWRALT